MHPIVAQLNPSPEQLPAVTAGPTDIVITAGAGTGKTRTLVARVLYLLSGGLELRRVIAITFTVKAASELRNRLRSEVQTYLAQRDLDPEERARWEEIYAGMDAARIGTIHSLCTEILRNHPAEAGVDPRFSVLDEAQGALLVQEAIEEAVCWAANDAGAASVFRLFAPNALQNLLRGLMANRLKAATLFAQRRWEGWAPAAVNVLRDRFLANPEVTALIASVDRLRQTGEIARAADQGDDLAADLLHLLDTWDAAQQAVEREDLAALVSTLQAMRSYVKGNRGRAPLWRPATPPKESVAAYRNQHDAIIEPLVKDVNLLLDRALAAALPAVERIFSIALARYGAAKALRSALDFDDLENGALQLLTENPAVLTRWRQETQALLVDEFQDTNDRQRNLVRLLAGDRGRLFLVGDAKQSIYRFRGAEVQVFLAEHARLAAGEGHTHNLSRSYRTHHRLLNALNYLLAGVLGEAGDLRQPWRAPFAALEAERELSDFGIEPPFVEVQLAPGSKSGGALERAAGALALRLSTLLDASSGKIKPEHIAILCRSYRGFSAYEDALERAGIPYVTVAGRGFYARPEIRDLLNTLQALADPTDDLAMMGLLRSPGVGFTDAEIVRLRLDGDMHPRPIWPNLQKTTDERGHWAVDLVRDLHAVAGRIRVADVLKRWLDATGYIAVFIQAGERRAARNVMKLLDDAHRSGLSSVSEFLEYVQNVRDVGGREGEARSDEEGVVQIMTVHQAKGLQFPIVVIGDAATSGAGRATGLLLDDQFGIMPNIVDDDGKRPLAHRLAMMRNQAQEDAESDRLLYVAATRAADKLIINGHCGVNRNRILTADGWLGDVLAALDFTATPESYNEEGGATHVLAAALDGEPVLCTLYEPKFLATGQPAMVDNGADTEPTADRPQIQRDPARLPVSSEAGWVWDPAMIGPVDPPPTESVATEAADGTGPTAVPAIVAALEAPDRVIGRRVWRVAPHETQRHAPAWVVGKLVHEAIAGWRFPIDASFPEWVAARARGYGLADHERIADAGRKTRILLERLQRSSLFSEMSAATQRLHELPYARMVDGEGPGGLQSGAVDVGYLDLLMRGDGNWTVVDFKTDRIRTPDDRRRVLAGSGFAQQLERYITAVEALVGQQPRVLLCLIDDGGRVTVLSGAEVLALQPGQDVEAKASDPGTHVERPGVQADHLQRAEVAPTRQHPDAWSEAMAYAAPACTALLSAVQVSGLPAPAVGQDIADGRGLVMATPELAWEDQRIAVLLPEQNGAAQLLSNAGWQVFWPEAVEAVVAALESV